jgi:hypothetical protein
MSILHRLLKIEKPQFSDEPKQDLAMSLKAKQADADLESSSQELRQTVQRIESRARVMNTWSGAMKMLTRDEE